MIKLIDNGQNQRPPLPLWKSSLSAVFSRDTADALVASPRIHDLMLFLAPTYCPDESLWASMTGNPQGYINIIYFITYNTKISKNKFLKELLIFFFIYKFTNKR
jgi:hypothetical protein